MRQSIIVIAALLAAAAGQAHAQPRVAIVSAASTAASSALTNNLDVQAKLVGTGLFSQVDIIDVAVHAAYTPTLQELQTYDAIITWSNGTYFDAVGLGNVLADYVDAGGGVVVATFANSSTTVNRRLEGRWRTGGDYEIVRSGGGNQSGSATLGTILMPGHPIMDGVNSFNGGTSGFRPATLQLSPHGEVVAQWSDGRTLVGISSQFPTRVDLGMYPPSSDVTSTWWVSSTDGARLMANALVYAAGGGPAVCYANCDGSTVEPVLNVDDFTCFINEFAQAQGLPHEQQVTHYANCDNSTIAPALNVDDFTCFINQFATGCP
jgi:hypothetical protein